MAVFSSKHGKRAQSFFINSFSEGLNQEIAPLHLPNTALTRCKNMKYAIQKLSDGTNIIVVKKRQGTEKITATALSGAVVAETYYAARSQYIVATTSNVYYLNASYVPVLIGAIEGKPTFTEFHGKLIIHDGGITKAWNGTTFETLNNLITDELLTTGGNVGKVDYTGTFAHLPIQAGSVTITYTDTTLKTITDNGVGHLIGDVSDAVSATIDYTTGIYSFRCTGSPDNTTKIEATYEQSAGAPKSKAGFVRAGSLYVYGDSDNPSRLYYTGPDDEDAWDSTSDGGYLDIDARDGYDLIGVVNYFQLLIAIKGNSIHRIDDFPGDTTFGAKPLLTGIGSTSYLTCLNDGNIISFLSKEGWLGLGSTDTYGDIAKTANISKNFDSRATRHANSLAYSDYNQIDKQLWLTLFDSTTQIPSVYVINMETGGQLSEYEFAFDHTSYKFVNNEMLIGGADGHLYRLFNKKARYKDNGVSYTPDTYIRGAMTNFGIPFNRKHNKKIFPHVYGSLGMTATLNIYTNADYDTAIYTATLTAPWGDAIPLNDWQDVLAYDMDEVPAGATRVTVLDKKFNYNEVMFEITNIGGAAGSEIYGIDFSGAVVGE
jgi:hypothetical protein